jgi:MFS family permease
MRIFRDPRLFVLGCVLLGGMGQGVVAPRLPELLEGTDKLALSAGFSAALMYLGIFVSTHRYGEIADRGQVHRLLAFGLLSYALSLLGLSELRAEWAIFLLRFLEGLSISAVFVGADFVLGRTSAPATRGQWLSYYGVALSVGLLLGPTIGLATSSLRLSLFIVAALALAGGLLSFRLRVDPCKGPRGEKPRLEPGALISAAGYGFLEAGLVAVFPVLAVSQFRVVPEHCLVVCILSAALSSIGWGLATDRFGAPSVVRVLLAGFALSPALLAAMALPPDWTAFLACAVFGILAGGLYPTGFAWLLKDVPETQFGYASGAFARSYGVGSLAGPLLVGASAHFFGARGFFLCMAGAGALSYLLALGQRQKQ